MLLVKLAQHLHNAIALSLSAARCVRTVSWRCSDGELMPESAVRLMQVDRTELLSKPKTQQLNTQRHAFCHS